MPNLDALYFTMLNSNKKSLTLNTKSPEGKAIMEKLIRQADVLVENFAPGTMDRMGFTRERIQELNLKFSDFTLKITGAPLLGEHTDEVLTMLGYSKEKIAAMHRNQIV